jgi:hypothetical protein
MFPSRCLFMLVMKQSPYQRSGQERSSQTGHDPCRGKSARFTPQAPKADQQPDRRKKSGRRKGEQAEHETPKARPVMLATPRGYVKTNVDRLIRSVAVFKRHVEWHDRIPSNQMIDLLVIRSLAPTLGKFSGHQ